MPRLPRGPGTDGGFPGVAAGVVRPVDLVLLLPPALLVGVYSLPERVKASVVLSYADPTVVTMFASHFVHFEPAHLGTNLLLSGIVVPLGAALSALADRRTRFYVTFVTVLVVFPITISKVNVALFRPRVGFGFSGLGMAFLGTLPHAVGWYASDRLPGEAVDASPVLFFAGTAVVALWAVPVSPASLTAGGASVLAAGLYLRSVARAVPGSLLATVDRGAREWCGFGLALAATLLVVLLPLAAFPQDPTGDGSVLNVYVHLVGFCFGYVVPFAAFGVADGVLARL